MLAISFVKDESSGKQFVSGWEFVQKDYTVDHPEIPGERMYFEEKKVPSTFYSSPYTHWFDGVNIVPQYPNRDPLARRFPNEFHKLHTLEPDTP